MYLVDSVDLLISFEGQERNEVLAHFVKRQVTDLPELVDLVYLDGDRPERDDDR
jgi:hypothetical protein